MIFLTTDFSSREELLWENNNPTGSFNAQTVILSNSYTNYSYIKLITNAPGSNLTSIVDIKSGISGNGIFANTIRPIDANATNFNHRNSYLANNNQMEFREGYTSSGKDNTISVPLKIIGIKQISQYKYRRIS